MASVFDTIKMKAGDTDRSNNWYRGQVNRIASGTTARELFRQGKLARRPSVGRLNLFGYNPKGYWLSCFFVYSNFCCSKDCRMDISLE